MVTFSIKINYWVAIPAFNGQEIKEVSQTKLVWGSSNKCLNCKKINKNWVLRVICKKKVHGTHYSIV